jgi:pimeloyl-ACP methyl ester carboxylesterase
MGAPEAQPRRPWFQRWTATLSARAARLMIAGWCGGVLLAILLLLALSAQTRLAARTALLLPSFFTDIPGTSQRLISATPRRETAELAPIAGFVRAHVYAPPGGVHPALVISLGIGPAPSDDPRVVRLMNGLARDGLVAILVESEALNNDTLAPDLPRALVEGVQYALSRADVRAGHVGLFGFSVGGALATEAARDPALAGKLRVVEAFGGYADLQDAIVSIATRTIDDNGRVMPWSPDDRAVEHLTNALTGALVDPAEAKSLLAHFEDGAALDRDPAMLSPQARAVYDLLSARNDRAAARAAIPGLPPIFAQDETDLSPLKALPDLTTPLFVMYDRDDPLLPFTGSRQICATRRADGSLPYCSAFSIFRHVEPGHFGNPIALSHDLVTLYLHALALLQRLQ